MKHLKRIMSVFVRVAIAVLFVAGSVNGSNTGFYVGQVSMGAMDQVPGLEHREMQHKRIRGVDKMGAFDDVQVLLTGNGVLETATSDSDGGFAFFGLPDGNYVVKVRKPGYRPPAARSFRLDGGLITPPASSDADHEFVLEQLDPNIFVFHWEEDQSTAGYDYSAHVNQPLEVEFLGEPVEVSDGSSAIWLNRNYNILLVDSENGSWTQEHAYRLLETMKTIPQDNRPSFKAESRGYSKWSITSEHVEDDIQITGGGAGSDRTVLISEEAFFNASPRVARIEGKRGRYYSQRLHHALVRFVTDNGRDEDAYEKILQERFGVTTRVTDHTTYRDLTASTTGEDASRFQAFHSEEIVRIINTFEEMPAGMHKIPGLRYLLRRLDGTPHPLYPGAPAVAWTGPGYIEFMDTAFLHGSVSAVHRLIIHEKAHFLWAHVFDAPLKSDWIDLGGWYQDPRSPSGWSTTKQTEFVSAYAHGINPNEDLAESIAYFVINPDKLKSRAIAKYEFVRDRIMQGNIYISKIREDLTFEVYNLFPDYVFPGKIRRVDIQVSGAPEEDKTVRIEVELHALDGVLEGATYVFMRIASEVGTSTDEYLYPVDAPYGRPGTVLATEFTLNKFAKASYWLPTWIIIGDEHGNQRFESVNDFGWSLYINNPLEDVTPPRYVRNLASLTKSIETREGRETQVIRVSWQVEENTAMKENWACYASLNDELPETYRLQEYGDFDAQSEFCEVSFWMPDYMPSSTYSLDYINMTDRAGNRNSFEFGNSSEPAEYEASPQIELITSNPDTEAPHVDLNAIRISAEPTNPSAPNGETLVTLTFRIRDNISGFVLGSLYLRDPQGIDHQFYIDDPNRGDLFPPGDPSQWTTHTWTVILPPGSAPGTWGLAEMTVWDRAKNFRMYDFTEILHFAVEGN